MQGPTGIVSGVFQENDRIKAMIFTRISGHIVQRFATTLNNVQTVLKVRTLGPPVDGHGCTQSPLTVSQTEGIML